METINPFGIITEHPVEKRLPIQTSLFCKLPAARYKADLSFLRRAIRGHVFWSFLALVLKKGLADRCATGDAKPEWTDVLRDLDRLQDIDINEDGERQPYSCRQRLAHGPLS